MIPAEVVALVLTPPPAAKAGGGESPEAMGAVREQIALIERVWDRGVDYAAGKGPAVLAAITLLVVAWILSKWVRRAIVSAMTRAKVDLLLAKFFANLARWAVLGFALVTCLGTLGIETTSLAAVIGAAGLAIGLALQGNLGNLASGVLLLIFRPFKIGDSVIVAGQTGVVDGIDLFTTYLDTADNRRIIIPNGQIFGGVIENQGHHATRSITLPVVVSGAIPLEQSEAAVRSMAQRVLGSVAGAIADPAPAVVLQEISPNVVWNVTIWFETARFGGARSAVLREIKRTLDREQLAPAPGVQLVRQM